ncbi:MAG: hypothetical protein IJS90_10365 [Clostridia bacterium]|nr:hypothetical protein [Clostridia bacterium]
MSVYKKIVSRLTKYDIAAIVLGALLFLCFALTVRDSVAMLDESSYWLLGCRLSFGDRLITDEWHLIQFTALINAPAYFLYTRLTGSTEGLILTTRWVFIIFDVLFYCYMYKTLRRFKISGIASAFLFCAMIPQFFLAFSYCTLSVYSLMALLLALCFDERRKSALRLFLLGVLLAVTVLEDPPFLFVYVLWACFSALYAVCAGLKKPFLSKAAFLLEKRTFLQITFGSVFVFAVFVVFLILNGAFDEIETVLPYLFSGEEYNLGNLFDADQIMQAVNFYNRYFLIGLLCCCAACVCARVFKIKSNAVRFSLFCLSLLLFAGCCIHGGIKMLQSKDYWNMMLFCQNHNIPLLLFAPVPFILSKTIDIKRVCSLIAGLLYSPCMDIPSKSFIGMGGFIVRVSVILQISDLLKEFWEGRLPSVDAPVHKAYGKRFRISAEKLLLSVTALSLLSCLLWDGMYIGAEWFYKPPEKLFLFSENKLDHSLEKGPFKGLKTTDDIAEIYDATLRDMDVIKEDRDCAVAMLDAVAFTYLYLERPFATFSMSYSGEIDRLVAYWKLPFTTKPDYVYLPYYNHFLMFRYESAFLRYRLSELNNYVECEVVNGEAGYIIHIKSIY